MNILLKTKHSAKLVLQETNAANPVVSEAGQLKSLKATVAFLILQRYCFRYVRGTLRFCLFLSGIVFLIQDSFGQLKVDFTANNTSNCAPMVVKFSGISSSNPARWKWDLGNGTVSTQQNPGVIYFNPGTYTVKLVVTSASGTDSVIKNDYITVYGKPVVNFSASPSAGCAPVVVQFTDSSTAGSGTISSWLWDFGDGAAQTVQNPSHTYKDGNVFGVVLTVTNSFGCKQVLKKPKLVTVSGKPKAGFSFKYTNTCQPPTVVNFINSSAPGPLNYQWDFGNGNTSAQASPVYTYDSAGDYKVKLVVTNATGCADTLIQTISIGTVRPDFTSIGNCTQQTVTFTNVSKPAPKSVLWSFGDGSTATTVSATHSYVKAGSYPVSALVDFGTCKVTRTKTVAINDKPVLSFTASGATAQCNTPADVQFNNTTTGAATYQWFFGDNTTASDNSPLHQYTQTGSFTVKLVAGSPDGCRDSLVQQNLVNLGPPQITHIQNLPYTGCTGDTVHMIPAISSPEAVISYTWDFGDGAGSTDQAPAHRYAGPGTYPVKLTVTTTTGCTGVFTDTVFISAVPVAGFIQNLTDVCASQPIQFTDQSSGPITGWFWNFGDGSISTAQNPSHLFDKTGKLQVVLTVTNKQCSSIFRGDSVIVHPPIAAYTVTNSCQLKFVKKFTDRSSGALTRTWDFGDGQTSVLLNPEHEYAKTGNYTVILTVTNGSCSSANTKTIYVIKQEPAVTYTPGGSVLCKYSKVLFRATNFDRQSIDSFYWNFGDGAVTPFATNDSVVTHVYNKQGNYTPVLVTMDKLGCRDTVATTAAFKIYGPTAGFAAAVAGTCVKSPVPVNDLSVTDGVHAIVQWIWDYGDGQKDTLSGPPFQHTYGYTDTFGIRLKVVDAYGCSDSLTKLKTVIITQPRASFSVSDTLRCAGSQVNFKNGSAGLGLNSSWDFGNGTTSVLTDPVYSYTHEGLFTVTLKITDKFGCTDSMTRQKIITISNPVASFNLTDTFAVCPPLYIQPVNTSLNYQSNAVSWTFDDNDISSMINPVHTYTNGGVYQLTLVVKGYGSCYDTAVKTVVLKGPAGLLKYTHSAGCEPVTVTMNATIRNASGRTLDFGDGVISVNKDSVLTHTYTNYGLYLPKLLLSDTTGCFLTIQSSDTIRVVGVKAGIHAIPQTGCDSSQVNFLDSSQVYYDSLINYTWQLNGNGQITSVRDQAQSYYKTGSYPVKHTITSSLGCQDSLQTDYFVKVNLSPAMVIHAADTACQKAPVQFYAEDTRATTVNSWQWDFGTGETAEIQRPVEVFNESGTYTIQVAATSTEGCMGFAYRVLEILPVPFLTATTDTTLCLGQSVTLNVSGADNYSWTSGETLSCAGCEAPVATPAYTTHYFVTGSTMGCSATDSVLVQVIRPFTLTVSADDSLCVGQSVQLHAGGALYYQWQPAAGLNNAGISNPVAKPLTTTSYTLIASGEKKCFSDTGLVKISVFYPPVFSIRDTNMVILSGFSDSIRTTGGGDIVRWEWTPSGSLSCYDCAQPVAQPRTTTVYKARVYNSLGCWSEDMVTVKVLCSDANVYIPNTFSPNGNEMNERFYPRGRGVFNIPLFQVFNRNGALVYEKRYMTPNAAMDGWDGNYKGQRAQVGTYVYVLQVMCENNGVITIKGNVSLIR